MKGLLVTAIFACPVFLAVGKPVVLSWSDNSDNEEGFEMRGRTASGEWEVLGRTVANVEEFQVESDTHEAWQVFAFNVWDKCSNGSNILEKGQKPNAPGALKVKRGNPVSNIFNRILNRRNRRS